MKSPKRPPKKTLSKILITTGIVIIVFFFAIVSLLLTKKPKDLEILNVDMSTIHDGSYTGSADNGLVKAAVSVEIRDGTLLNISILEHDNLLGKSAEIIIDSIIEQQTLEVDTITSATYSSNTIKKAIENALRKGE